jgi:hypothetical protein
VVSELEIFMTASSSAPGSSTLSLSRWIWGTLSLCTWPTALGMILKRADGLTVTVTVGWQYDGSSEFKVK